MEKIDGELIGARTSWLSSASWQSCAAAKTDGDPVGLMREHIYYVYILASQRNGTLYIGVTNNIYRRIQEHKNKTVKGFTAKYNVTQLVWYKEHSDIAVAIACEKQRKKFYRWQKIELIETHNFSWRDLSEHFLDTTGSPSVFAAAQLCQDEDDNGMLYA